MENRHALAQILEMWCVSSKEARAPLPARSSAGAAHATCPATGPRPSPSWRHSGPRWRKSHVSSVTDKTCSTTSLLLRAPTRSRTTSQRERFSDQWAPGGFSTSPQGLQQASWLRNAHCGGHSAPQGSLQWRCKAAWPALIAVALQGQSLKRQLEQHGYG